MIDGIEMDFDSVQRQMQEATNVVRWNPLAAIAWMREAESKCDTVLLVHEYNKAAKIINYHLDITAKMRYFQKTITSYRKNVNGEEFEWQNPETRVPLLEQYMSVKEWKSIYGPPLEEST